MTVRPATESDIPRLVQLLLQVGQVHHQIRPDIFTSGTLKYDQSSLLELLQDPTRPIFVAELDDAVQGYCFCVHRIYEGSSVSTRRSELYIDDLCVDESYRGQGVSQALYNHISDYAVKQGFDFITLNVWCGNRRAMAFYEKIGLTPRNITMEKKLGGGEA